MRKNKKQHHEEHVDETWLIPYSDMLTLLLALFIVMFAMSKVDNEKLKKVGSEFNAIFSSGRGVLNEEGSQIIEQAEPEIVPDNVIEDNKMKEIMGNLQNEIGSSGYSDKVKVELNEGGLEISIQDVLLFNSGDAAVLNEVTPLLMKISQMVKNLDNDIKVVGHTDNVPIHTSKFPSNWELSAMRAINVMNFMVDTGEVNPKKLSVQAYGEQMPKFDNSTKDGRAKNRRVEIFIVRKYSMPTDDSNKN